jgi:hypothetical protein
LIYRHTALVATCSIDVVFLAICDGRQSSIGALAENTAVLPDLR